jgi:hypothetical protein
MIEIAGSNQGRDLTPMSKCGSAENVITARKRYSRANGRLAKT